MDKRRSLRPPRQYFSRRQERGCGARFLRDTHALSGGYRMRRLRCGGWSAGCDASDSESERHSRRENRHRGSAVLRSQALCISGSLYLGHRGTETMRKVKMDNLEGSAQWRQQEPRAVPDQRARPRGGRRRKGDKAAEWQPATHRAAGRGCRAGKSRRAGVPCGFPPLAVVIIERGELERGFPKGEN